MPKRGVFGKNDFKSCHKNLLPKSITFVNNPSYSYDFTKKEPLQRYFLSIMILDFRRTVFLFGDFC